MIRNVYYVLKCEVRRWLDGKWPCRQKKQEGFFRVRMFRPGRLYRKIGIGQLAQVRGLTVTGQVDMNDMLLVQQMDNLEYLDLSYAYFRKRNGWESTRLRQAHEEQRRRKALRKILLPRSLKQVPGFFFCDCPDLECVVLSEATWRIGSHAFSGSGIREVVVPPSVRRIEPHAFDNCPNLERVVVEDSRFPLKWRGMQFGACPALKEVYIGRNSGYEYALCSKTEIGRVVLGPRVRDLNLEVRSIGQLVCLMKRPPRMTHVPNGDCVCYVKHNWELFWINPDWRRLALMRLG